MTQQTKAINLTKFEAGDRPTDQDFTDLFDSILFINESNGLSSNSTTLLGDFDIGGSLSILGGGNIAISGSFSAGDPTAGVAGGRISAFTATDSPPFYASSSISEVMFSGISSKTTSSIALTTKGSNELTSGDVRFGIENGKGFLDAQGTTVISYSTGSSATAGGDNIIHMSASVGIGTNTPGVKLHVSDDNGALPSFGVSTRFAVTQTTNVGGYNAMTVIGGNSTGASTYKFGDVDNEQIGRLTYLHEHNRLDIFTNNARAITIDSSQKVGIGLSNPTEKLHIKGTSAATRIKVETTTGNAIMNMTSTNAAFQWLSRGDSDQFDLYDVNAGTTPFKIVGGNPANTLVLDGAGKVGIGTVNPSQKLDIAGGHIQLESGYGIGRNIGTSGDEYIIYPYLTGMPTSFTNITAQGTIGSNGMSLQSDQTINFIETDDNVLVGHMDLNSKVFDWDGLINANQFKGDGSQLTGITGGQITGFVSTPGDNRLVTSNATGDGVFGEANLTFDGSTLAFTSAATDPGTNGYIGFPLLDDTGGEIFRTALKFPSTDDRALIQYGTVTNDDFELRLRLQDGNADKFVIISDSSNDYRALDINGNRALFFSDNSAGKVGIGVTPTATLHVKSTGVGTVTGLFDGDEDGILHVNAGSGGTVGDNDAVIRLQRQGNSKWGIITKADTGLRIYDYDSSADHTFFKTGGNVGIGTTDPAAKLDVRGDVVISDGTDPAITLFNNDTVANGPDILFHQAGLIAAEGKIHLNINSDGGSDDLFIRTGGDTDSATEIARFTDTGRFGLGGIDPGHQLHIKSAATNSDVFVISSAGTAATKIIQLSDTTNGHGLLDMFTNGASHNVRIYAGGTSWLNGGDVGIGTASPGEKLEVVGNILANGLFFNNNTNNQAFIKQLNTAGNEIHIGSDNRVVFTETDANTIVANFVLNEGYFGFGSDFTPTKVLMAVADGPNEMIYAKTTDGGPTYITTDTSAADGDTHSAHLFREDGNIRGAVGWNAADSTINLTNATGINSSKGIRINSLGKVMLHDHAVGDPIIEFGSQYAAIRKTTSQNGLIFGCDSSLVLHAGDNTGSDLSAKLNISSATTNENIHLYADGHVLITTEGQIATTSTIEDHKHFAFYDNGQFAINNKDSSHFHTSVIGADGNGAAPAIYIKSRFEGNNGTDATNGGGIRFTDNNTDEYFDQAFINGALMFSHRSGNSGNANKVFKVTSSGHTNTFTGQHYNLPSTGQISDYNNKVGHIVISTGTYKNANLNISEDTPTINEALPKVALSENPNDKRVFGVISNAEDENGTREHKFGNLVTWDKVETNNRLIINSVGEGAIMICNINGNLENGDYITTSHIEGLGMKQDDDLLHNYTVAKITQDCNFASGTTDVTHNGVTYKAKLVGCTYHCG